jgi:hypothetical protein
MQIKLQENCSPSRGVSRCSNKSSKSASYKKRK